MSSLLRRARMIGPLILALSLLACHRETSVVEVTPSNQLGPGPAATGPPLFSDRTAGSGINFTYRNGEEANHFAILESLGGGVALIDFDGDGLLDIYVPGGGGYAGPDKKQIIGHPGRLYRNLGNFKFEDVTAKVGLDVAPCYSNGAAVCDYDRDGWPDLLVTGYGRLALYHNVPDGKGGRKFVDVTREAGLLGDHFWGTSAAWADLDGDGWPDLYVCQYVPWSWENDPKGNGYRPDVTRDVATPKQFGSVAHALFRNNGNGTFTNVTQEAGIRVPPRPDGDYGKGLGVLIADFDGDGKPDIYVANDTTDNFLYLNRSTPGRLRFEENGLLVGVARDGNGVPNGSMGVDCADYDGTGRPSIFVTNYENELHALYRNLKVHDRLFFNFQSYAAGIGAIGTNYVGFGTAFVDFDRDGWEDILISNGHVVRFPPRDNVQQRPVLLRNVPGAEGQRRFADVTAQGGPFFQTAHRGRGLAIGDLDNDGRTDFVVSMVNEPVRIVRNEAAPSAHWLGVELLGRERRDIVGARLTLEVNGRKLVRFAKGGASYLSSSDRRIVFGLGEATQAGRLTIEWPSGEPRVQHFEGLAIDKYHRLEQK